MKQFEVGKQYATASFCDSDCIFRFEVVKRTAKTVWIRYWNEITRRRIRVRDGVEQIDPLGQYSMSPILGADDEVVA